MFPAGQVLPIGQQTFQASQASVQESLLNAESRNNKSMIILNTGNISINIQTHQQPVMQEQSSVQGRHGSGIVHLPLVNKGTKAVDQNRSSQTSLKGYGQRNFFVSQATETPQVPALERTRDVLEGQASEKWKPSKPQKQSSKPERRQPDMQIPEININVFQHPYSNLPVNVPDSQEQDAGASNFVIPSETNGTTPEPESRAISPRNYEQQLKITKKRTRTNTKFQSQETLRKEPVRVKNFPWQLRESSLNQLPRLGQRNHVFDRQQALKFLSVSPKQVERYIPSPKLSVQVLNKTLNQSLEEFNIAVRTKNLNDDFRKSQLRLRDLQLPGSNMRVSVQARKQNKGSDVNFMINRLNETTLEQVRNSTQSEPQPVQRSIQERKPKLIMKAPLVHQKKQKVVKSTKLKQQIHIKPIKLPDLKNFSTKDQNKKTVLSKNIEKSQSKQSIIFQVSKETDSEDSQEEHFISPYNNIARFANDVSSRVGSKENRGRNQKRSETLSIRSKEISTDELSKINTDESERKKSWGVVKPNSRIFGPFSKVQNIHLEVKSRNRGVDNPSDVYKPQSVPTSQIIIQPMENLKVGASSEKAEQPQATEQVNENEVSSQAYQSQRQLYGSQPMSGRESSNSIKNAMNTQTIFPRETENTCGQSSQEINWRGQTIKVILKEHSNSKVDQESFDKGQNERHDTQESRESKAGKSKAKAFMSRSEIRLESLPSAERQSSALSSTNPLKIKVAPSKAANRVQSRDATPSAISVRRLQGTKQADQQPSTPIQNSGGQSLNQDLLFFKQFEDQQETTNT